MYISFHHDYHFTCLTQTDVSCVLSGFTISRVLNILEILDRHTFERVESGNSLDTLYNKTYSSIQPKDSSEVGIQFLISLIYRRIIEYTRDVKVLQVCLALVFFPAEKFSKL